VAEKKKPVAKKASAKKPAAKKPAAKKTPPKTSSKPGTRATTKPRNPATKAREAAEPKIEKKPYAPKPPPRKKKSPVAELLKDAPPPPKPVVVKKRSFLSRVFGRRR
jgi:histone H1/5